MLKIRNLEAGYGKLKVLKHISMHVDAGEIVTIIGANGAGKTTLLSAIAGLVRASSGQIIFNGKDLRSLAASSIPALGCVMVPEGRQIFAPMTVEENLLLGGHVIRHQGRIGAGRAAGLPVYPFPDPEGATDAAGRDLVRRRTADAGHGPGP